MCDILQSALFLIHQLLVLCLYPLFLYLFVLELHICLLQSILMHQVFVLNFLNLPRVNAFASRLMQLPHDPVQLAAVLFELIVKHFLLNVRVVLKPFVQDVLLHRSDIHQLLYHMLLLFLLLHRYLVRLLDSSLLQVRVQTLPPLLIVLNIALQVLSQTSLDLGTMEHVIYFIVY